MKSNFLNQKIVLPPDSLMEVLQMIVFKNRQQKPIKNNSCCKKSLNEKEENRKEHLCQLKFYNIESTRFEFVFNCWFWLTMISLNSHKHSYTSSKIYCVWRYFTPIKKSNENGVKGIRAAPGMELVRIWWNMVMALDPLDLIRWFD